MYHHNGIDHHDVELVRGGYEAWNRGELAAVIDLVHPGFRWDAPPGVVVPRGGVGHRDLEPAARRFWEAWAEFRCEPEEFRNAGELMVALVVEEGRRRGSDEWVRRRFFHVWSIRGGKVIRFSRVPCGGPE